MSDAPPRKNSLRALWLMLAVAVAPVAASYVVYYFWHPGRTANYGELIGPSSLPDAQLALTDGAPFRLSQLRGKWMLVMLDSGRCDGHCERKLVYMRQLRLTQGKEMERVERVWLITDASPPRAEAIAPFEGTWRVRAAGAEVLKVFPSSGSASEHIYVIDPLGNLMMRFPRDPDPQRMVKDLARLLRTSRIG